MTDGLVVVDKPAGWTSHDVVSRCRRVFGQRRVGHAGTLDPDATGVLLVGLGGVTRLLRFLADLPKTYVGEVVLGVETSTLDAAGEVTAVHDMAGVTDEQVRRACARFTGAIQQVPPMVSAVKIGGKRLHQLARQGIEVDRPPRPVEVIRLEPGRVAGGAFPILVECSSGTYVRSLAADIGHALGGGAHLRRLRRTRIGPFGVEAAVPLDDLGPGDVLGPVEVWRGRPSVTVDQETAAAVGHGRVLPPRALGLDGTGTSAIAVLDLAGDLLAIYEPAGTDSLKPAVVLSGGTSGR